MSADFTPSLNTYTDLTPFRFWCQKVLPFVYDDSLSYYELLCKVVDYLNKTMEDVTLSIEDVENLHTAYENLQGYVNDYFDNLDVQDEINNKLDALVENGTIHEIFNDDVAAILSVASEAAEDAIEAIPANVTNWLNEHVNPESDVVIDDTLSIEGAAADAKATGDEINELKSDLTTITNNNVQRNLLGKNIGALYPVDIKRGQNFTVSTKSGIENTVSGVKILYHRADGTYFDYNSFGIDLSSKTYTLAYDGVKYISQSVAASDILQLEIGDTVTPYQEYPENNAIIEQLAETGKIVINNANLMTPGTYDENGYIFYNNRMHLSNIFVKATKGDRCIGTSDTHDILLGVIANPMLGSAAENNMLYSSGWVRSFDYVVQQDGYYVILAKAVNNTFDAEISINKYFAWNGITKDIRPYYINELETTLSTLKAITDEPALVFPVVTDIHRYTASVQTFDDMINNMRYIKESAKIDFIANTGDTIEGNASQETSLGIAYDSIGAFRDIGLPFMYSEGNHDNNPYISSGALTFNLKQVYGGFFTSNKDVTFNANENGTDYYYDFNGLGVRYISLNSCNSAVSNSYGYGESTADWLAEALNTNNIVIIATHVSPYYQHVWNNIGQGHNYWIKRHLETFANNGGKLIIITGHSHIDAEFVTPHVEVTNVCQKFEQANISTEQYQAISGMIDGLRNPARTQNTYTADAWTICVVKPISNEVDFIRFGAGVDRFIHYVPIAPGTVTSRFENPIWSSSDTSVATVSNGVIIGVSSGRCAIKAKDASGNLEFWVVDVA